MRVAYTHGKLLEICLELRKIIKINNKNNQNNQEK